MAEKNQTITFKTTSLVSPEQTEQQIIAKLNESAGSGTPARAGIPIFDGDGRRVQVQIIPPSESNAAQIAEATQHPGVAFVRECFPQLQLNDLDAANGIVTGSGFPALGAGHIVTVSASGLGGLGSIDSGGYADRSPLSSAGAVSILIFNLSGADIVIPIGATITLNYAGGPTVFTFTKALTIKGVAGFQTRYDFFTDDQGNLIVRFGSNVDGSGNVFTEFSDQPDYLVACQDPLRAF